MIKQPLFSLAFSLTLLTGAAITAVGQTTNTMPTTQSGTMTTPRSQTTGSTMSNSQTGTSGMSSMSGTSGMSSMSGTSGMSSMSGNSGMSGTSGSMSPSSQTSTSGMSSMSGTSGMSSSSGSMSSSSGSSMGSMGTSTGKDLAASAGLSPDHSTLLKALVAAGLADRAKGAGPFTIFAPTNDAFNKLPSATLTSLMTPAMKKQLTGILTTHVVPGSVMAADLKDGQTIKTVSGETLTVSKQGSTVMIKDAKGGSATVTMADIKATNGVVHSIDTVLMPSK